MHFLRSLSFSVLTIQILVSQVPKITPAVVPGPGEIYTYRFIKQPAEIDTLLIGENVVWDFNKIKDTATYYEEVYRESLPSQNEIFDDAYSVDSNSIRSEISIWVNYLDSFKYYRMGAYEKEHIPMGDIPYIYDDTLMLLKFPFSYNEKMSDRYAFIKDGRRHHKSQYIEVQVKYDAYGTLILPNGDTCYQAIRIRREERFFNKIDNVVHPSGIKIYFYWYSAIRQNYFIRLIYINGKPYEAWYQKKRSLIKKKKVYN